MTKICGESISKSSEIVFKSCIEKSKWEKANVVEVHKKGDKQVKKKLPTCFITSNTFKNI